MHAIKKRLIERVLMTISSCSHWNVVTLDVNTLQIFVVMVFVLPLVVIITHYTKQERVVIKRHTSIIQPQQDREVCIMQQNE